MEPNLKYYQISTNIIYGYLNRKRLFTGMFPVKKKHLNAIVPVNKEHLTGILYIFWGNEGVMLI